MTVDPRQVAQRRADQIRAFRDELARLEADDASPLTPGQRAAIEAYHERLLEALAREFDVDRSAEAGQLSRGLRLASLFGAAMLVATATAVLEPLWGRLTLPAQVTLLCAFPLASLAGVELAARRERTRYVASLLALTACGTAWFAIVQTADLLDVPFSALLLWPCAGFGLAVAASYGFRWVLAASEIVAVVAVAAVFFAAGGVPWTSVFDRLEPLMLTGFGLAWLGRSVAEGGEGFEQTTRLTGILVGLLGLFALAVSNGSSLLALPADTTTALYMAVMLVVSVVLLWHRGRAGDRAGVTLVATILALFLMSRYVDWFWDWMPAWAFFGVLAGSALTAIAVLRWRRRRLEGAPR